MIPALTPLSRGGDAPPPRPTAPAVKCAQFATVFLGTAPGTNSVPEVPGAVVPQARQKDGTDPGEKTEPGPHDDSDGGGLQGFDGPRPTDEGPALQRAVPEVSGKTEGAQTGPAPSITAAAPPADTAPQMRQPGGPHTVDTEENERPIGAVQAASNPARGPGAGTEEEPPRPMPVRTASTASVSPAVQGAPTGTGTIAPVAPQKHADPGPVSWAVPAEAEGKADAPSWQASDSGLGTLIAAAPVVDSVPSRPRGAMVPDAERVSVPVPARHADVAGPRPSTATAVAGTAAEALVPGTGMAAENGDRDTSLSAVGRDGAGLARAEARRRDIAAAVSSPAPQPVNTAALSVLPSGTAPVFPRSIMAEMERASRPADAPPPGAHPGLRFNLTRVSTPSQSPATPVPDAIALRADPDLFPEAPGARNFVAADRPDKMDAQPARTGPIAPEGVPVTVRSHAAGPIPDAGSPAATGIAAVEPAPAATTADPVASAVSAPDGRAEIGPKPGAPVQAAPAQGAEIARHVMAQMTDRTIAAPGSYELSLSPEELGRLRIVLTPGEGTVSVQISGDRPDTLDLLRRHADLLSQEFRAMGFGETRFDFGDRPTSSPRGGSGGTDDAPSAADPVDPDPVSRTAPAAVPVDGLDMRL